jgi:transketolase
MKGSLTDAILAPHRYAGRGAIIGRNTFGASAPLKDLQRRFGFEAENVVRAAKEQIARGGHASKEQGSRKPQSDGR